MNVQEILYFKHLVRNRHAGMVVMYLMLRGAAYKQEIEQDLRISQQSVNIALDTLIEDGLTKPMKADDGRLREYYEPTPSGRKVACLILEMVKLVKTSATEKRAELEHEHKKTRG